MQIIQAPTTVTNNTSAGTGAWVDFNNVKVDDGAMASWVGGGGVTSNLLKCIFDFTTLPPNDSNTLTVINSVVFTVRKYASANSSGEHIEDFYVKLFHSDGVVVGNNLAKSGRWSLSESAATYTIDASTLAALDVNYVRATNFGMYFQVDDGTHAGDAFIDYIEMTIDYTTSAIENPNEGPFTPVLFNSKIFNGRVLFSEEETNVSIL